jgi:hypothetical protein
VLGRNLNDSAVVGALSDSQAHIDEVLESGDKSLSEAPISGAE